MTYDSLGVEEQNQPLADEGITVKGSEMQKDYRYTTLGELEEPQVIVLRLKGTTKKLQTPIVKPLAVSSMLVCSSCGKKCRSSFKYCPRCGTYLE